MRPEAWLLAGLYFLWMSWDATWPERFRYAALTAIGPVLWALTDFVVTGDPLSLNSTQDLAEELRRQKSGSSGPRSAACVPSRDGQDTGVLRRSRGARDRAVEVPASVRDPRDPVPGRLGRLRRERIAGSR